ncbi:Tubulin-specific chaperone A [Leucoagaricus sp. SymC.cos]|nr:Tubulin-specific chaperone A [Leucoagaricus sp. SymC.cos]
MSELASIQKQLKIKSGSVKRYTKEAILYQKEVDQLKEKLDKFLPGKAEEWEMKNIRRMIEESEKMVLDTATRLSKAAGELGDLVKQVEGKAGVADTEEFANALELAKQAKDSV